MSKDWIKPGIESFLKKKEAKINAIISKYSSIPELRVNFRNILLDFLLTESISDLFEYTALIQAFYDIKNGGWETIHFRGESKDFGDTNNLSTWFRSILDRNPQEEIEEVRDFQKSKLGCQLMAKFVRTGDTNARDHPWWWILTQHHAEDGKKSVGRRYRTRLLDITRNPFTALYFACNSNHTDDAIVHLYLDLDKPHELLPAPNQMLGKSTYGTFEEYIRDDYKKFSYDRLVKIDYSELSVAYELVKRLVAQSGEFLLQYERRKDTHRRNPWIIRVDGKSKHDILKQLNKLLNISETTLMINETP